MSGADKLAEAAEKLIGVGLTPAQVAYVFRGILDDVVDSKGVVVDEIADAVSVGSAAIVNGFSMADDEGYCYLKGIKVASRIGVANLLGRKPTIEQFVGVGTKELDDVALRRLTFDKTDDRTYHLRPAKHGEITADLSVLATRQYLDTGFVTARSGRWPSKVPVRSLMLSARVGEGAGKSCALDKYQCLEAMTREVGKTLAVIGSDAVTEYIKHDLSVVVVCDLRVKPFAVALFKSCTVLTPEELRTVGQMYDVVVVFGAIAHSLRGMQARFIMAMQRAHFLVSYVVASESPLNAEVLEYISSMREVRMSVRCACAITYRIPAFEHVEHTVLGALISSVYGGLDHAAERSTGEVGRCLFTTTLHVGRGVPVVTTDVSTTLCDSRVVGIDEVGNDKHRAIVLVVHDGCTVDDMALLRALSAFTDVLYVYANTSITGRFTERVMSVLTSVGAYTGVAESPQQLMLTGDFLDLTRTGGIAESFSARVTRDFNGRFPFVSSRPVDINCLLEINSNIGGKLTYAKLTKTSKRGMLYEVGEGVGLDRIVFGGKSRFLCVYSTIPIMVVNNGNWFHITIAEPFVVQRGASLSFMALHKKFCIFAIGMEFPGWMKLSESRLLGRYSGCWAAGNWSPEGGVVLPSFTALGDGTAECQLTVQPGVTDFTAISNPLIVQRVHGECCLKIGGVVMTSESDILCVSGGLGAIENYGPADVVVKLLCVEDDYLFDDGGPSGDDFSDGVDECI